MIIFLSLILAVIVGIVMWKSKAGANVISGIIGGITLLMILVLIASSC